MFLSIPDVPACASPARTTSTRQKSKNRPPEIAASSSNGGARSLVRRVNSRRHIGRQTNLSNTYLHRSRTHPKRFCCFASYLASFDQHARLLLSFIFFNALYCCALPQVHTFFSLQTADIIMELVFTNYLPNFII